MAAQRGRHRADRLKHPAHRSQSFEVRRWLQLGAASAGMGAALLGYSLLGPTTGVAAADSSGDSSSVSRVSSNDSPRADRDARRGARTASSERDGRDTRRAGKDTSAQSKTSLETKDLDDALERTVVDEVTAVDDAEAVDDSVATTAGNDSTTATPSATQTRERRTHARLADTQAEAHAAATSDPVVLQSALPPEVMEAPVENPGTARQQRIAAIIDNWTARRLAYIDSLPVDQDRKAELEANMWALRRALMNQTPTVAPVQITGKLTGPIEGTLNAVDPDGDALRFVLTVRPRQGTVLINDDGTYTYTPNESFDGVDSFRVIAVDGWRTNIFDPFRGLGTRATHFINQGAITFAFNYTTGATHWTPSRRDALQDAANNVIVFFVVERPVVLNIDVTGEDNADSNTLASASSSLIRSTAGFWRTVVQHKLLTGRDANGSAADGQIDFNFGQPWGYGDEIADDEYDFASTVMHELIHTFGFTAGMRAPGLNTRNYWSTFNSFIVDENGRSPFTRFFYRWNSAFDDNLTGGSGGLYFGGQNAMAAFGGQLVPLYTPNPWEQGSSVGHLDDNTFVAPYEQLMNALSGTGLGIRTLSAVEMGILRDLGYTVHSYNVAWGFVGLVLLGRRRKKAGAAR